MAIPISQMAASVKPSATMAAGAKAKQMKAEGIRVYDFSLGEPDFNTPEHICQAAYQAMQNGQTHYTPAPGTMSLRAAIADHYKKTHGLNVNQDNVIISNGAKHSLHNALASTVGPGDEVIIPAPYWVSYSDLVQMTGASYVLVPTSMESGFKMSPDQLRSVITSKSRSVMLNSPSNPTGSVYSRDELKALADVIVEKGLWVVSDEIYERLIYPGHEATCFATLRDDLFDRTITISGVSKSYAMTGWRIGWTLGPVDVIKAMSRVQSQQSGCPSSVSQAAAQAAIQGDQQCVESMRKEFEARRELVCGRLAALPDIKCPMPGGAFYAFFDISAYFGRTLSGKKITDSMSFCAAALDAVQVNLVPGAAFGAEGSVRLSFAASKDELNSGLDQFAKFLAS